jgi:hypothetical protein
MRMKRSGLAALLLRVLPAVAWAEEVAEPPSTLEQEQSPAAEPPGEPLSPPEPETAVPAAMTPTRKCTGTAGPLYVEAFASDVLGARLMGAEFSLDMQHVLFGQP